MQYLLKCSGCNREISDDESYFSGYFGPSRNSGKFGCGPHIYCCEECTKKLSSLWNIKKDSSEIYDKLVDQSM